MQNPVRILMIGDSSLDAELATAELNSAGILHETKRVQDFAAFANQIENDCPDLILSEDTLPGFDGFLALSVAQKHCPDIPFLFLSGAKGEEVATESLKRGAADYVLKQHLERLAPAVRRALSETRQRVADKQAQEEMARKARELTLINGDLQQLAYAASHDLQEPLRTISLFSKLLATRYHGALDREADEYLGYLESAALHMSALLEDLLTYSKISGEDRKNSRVNLNHVVDEVIVLFQTTTREANAVVTRDELPEIWGNRSQLGLIFQNLIGNAIKYRGDDPPRVHISAGKHWNSWTVAIKDNGIGFDQRYAEQIFGLFKRLNNRDFPGTGLGLAICKRIIEIYGGRIWAESQPNAGSTFFFSLPVSQTSSVENPAARRMTAG